MTNVEGEEQAASRLALRWGAATDVGRVRQQNEDSVWASATLFAVADGMGGHAGGEVASALAIEELRRSAELGPLTPQVLAEAIWQANDRIVAEAAGRHELLGMGTTLTGIAVVATADGERWAVFNVGDSRVYRYADGSLTRLTVDHSAVQELIAAGRLTPDEARRHPRRNVVTRSLGSDPAPVPDIWLFPPVPGDRFLVCSDGLTGELADTDIATLLREFDDPQTAADELVRCANEAGGNDNVTTIVVDLRAAAA
ncbi:PP2C family protein-serine/threonine phosphatase [Jatrophihabitans lederbergiae]|uniref:Protein phosphatase 2C domain-containing protein n=1 Tax=Jatrophihabitans lederbergiae TaxID=3075547 RepID=A0ABU2JDI6_9ACTN|nr:protein phosphatase 2C domain-containing protein [Jatrophihabitans sp. DSM 44399]MDT0262836.1 protein phosphatase 2C domain-containing protein [Jatrophihabitans sp. DSM 44399]